MGLFDFLKKLCGEEKITYNGATFWAPKPISNAAYQRQRQKEVDRLERKYDLSTVPGIEAIPVPRQRELPSGGPQGVTGRIDYYLMLKAGGYEKAGEVDLAIACYRKSNALMAMSPTYGYEYDRYMRLPRYLRKLRRFDEAREEEAKIKLLFPGGGVFSLTKVEFMENMRASGHTKAHAEELYRNYKADRDKERQREVHRMDYDFLWEFVPDLCPKSFSAYMRMKNGNTEKFQALILEAKKRNHIIK